MRGGVGGAQLGQLPGHEEVGHLSPSDCTDWPLEGEEEREM